MMHPVEDLEGIARDIHDATGIDCPIDAFLLAQLCDLETVPWMRLHGQIVGRRIRYPAQARVARQHGVVAHEIGHWALERAKFEKRCERSARYLAGALMLPQGRFLRDLAHTEWDLFKMLGIHVFVSAEMMAVRMCQVSPAVASIYDQGKKTRRYFGEHAVRDDETDDELADRVLSLQMPMREGVATAWPITDDEHRRVVVVRRAA